MAAIRYYQMFRGLFLLIVVKLFGVVFEERGRAFFVEGGIVVRYFLTTFSAESLIYQK
jgi:hypothetical protein